MVKHAKLQIARRVMKPNIKAFKIVEQAKLKAGHSAAAEIQAPKYVENVPPRIAHRAKEQETQAAVKDPAGFAPQAEVTAETKYVTI